jgi:WD40 repeat protein
MKHLSTARQGCPIAKLRFHPHRRLLASVAGPRAEVCVWGWDESRSLECLARIHRAEATRVRDVAWHPRENLLAVVGGGRAIELWAEGRLLKTLGKHPILGRVREYSYGTSVEGGEIEIHTSTEEIPLDEQGYDAVVFSANGARLVASRFGEDPQGEDPSEIYDVATGELVATFWRSDTTLALHPEGEIVATLSSDQGASSIRFGRITDVFQGHNVQVNVFADGYGRLVFSPGGEAFAIAGHAYAVGLKVFQFPSCRLSFAGDLESWEDVWKRLWEESQRGQRGSGGPGGQRPPHEFISHLWPMADRVAFSPEGRRLLFAMTSGHVAELDLETPESSRSWPAHDGPAVALDTSPCQTLLATASFGGEIKLWHLEETATGLGRTDRPATEAFLERFEPIDSGASEDSFRTTDGKRWYNFETIGDEVLAEDAPPWAQIAKAMRQRDRESGDANQRDGSG